MSAIINWWANPPQILIPAALCPLSPEGQAQSAPAELLASEWLTLYHWAFWGTVILAVVAVVITYYTRRMGAKFTPRWWGGLLVTAIAAGGVAYVMITWPEVSTFGCQYGQISTNVPTTPAIQRSLVAAAQSVLFFVVASLILTRIVRRSRWQPFYNNSRFPF